MRRFYSFALGVALLTMSVASALPNWVEEENRGVLLELGPDQVERASTGSVIDLDLDATEATKSFALRLPLIDSAAGWVVEVNGALVEQDPVIASDGIWYQIPSIFFVEGVNTVEVSTARGQIPPLADVLLFSLENSAEEVHFDRFAGDIVPLSQPAVHPDQWKYDVQHVDMAITLNMSAATIPTATVTLTAESLDSTLSQCVLDLNDNAGQLTVSAVDNGSGSPLAHTHNTGEDRLYITLPAPVPAGNTFTVRVTYSGTPAPNDSFRYTTHSGAPLIYTESQPYVARDWWPCKDINSDKFTIDLHVTVPEVSYSGYPVSVVSNGTLVSTVDNGSTVTYNWAESYPVSPQYVSLAATNYRAASGTYTALDGFTTMEVAHHVYPESYATESGAVPATIDVMEFFADTFGEYPFLSEKYWTATWGRTYGMEHQTCTSINNGNLADGYSRRNVHELFHMWTGDCVGVETFDHIWLSEAWATYAEPLFYEYQSGMQAYHDYVNAWSTSDAYPIVSGSGDSFNTSIVYRKGAWVFHMLRHIIGDDDFFQSARNYLADNALRYATANTDDYINHVEAVVGSDMNWFFDQWLYRAERPTYSWSWSWQNDGTDSQINLSIDQTQSSGTYEMPIDFGVIGLSGRSATVITVHNDADPQVLAGNAGSLLPSSVVFDPDNWILENHNSSQAPFGAPTLLSAVGNGALGTATVTWEAFSTPGLVGYRLFRSADGLTGWTLAEGEGTLTSGVTSTTVSGLSPQEMVHFALVPVNGSGPMGVSDALGVRMDSGPATVLIVDGYDRWDSQSVNVYDVQHDFVVTNGRAIDAYGTSFDSCANERVGTGVNLTDYDIVVWICGDESTIDETFSASEQGFVEAFLEGGGKLFVSGNEIGWDLGRATQPQADQDFYNDYLKAAFVDDNANDYTVAGPGASSAFGSHAFSYGDGGDSPYLPGFPDQITTAGGSSVALDYSGSAVAGVQYEGTFGAGSTPGQLVHLGFAFETVYPESARNQLMADVLEWFGAATAVPAGLVVLGVD